MSASAPAGSASSIRGKLSAASTSATIDGDDDNEVINQPAPTSCIQVPMFETMVAIHKLRKSAFFSGLHADCSVRGGAGAWEGADGKVFKETPGLFSAPPSGQRRWQEFRSSWLYHQLVDIAPTPILPWLEGGHNRMLSRSEMPGRVPVL